MKKIFLLIFLFAVVAGFSSCKTRIIGLEHDPAFNYKTMSQNRFAIAGVTDPRDSYWFRENRVMYGELMRESFLKKRKKMRLLDVSAVKNFLGTDNYLRLVKQYGSFGILNPEDISLLAAKLPGTRYLVVARVNYHKLRQWRRVEDIKEELSEEDKKNEKVPEVIGQRIVKEIEREMSVTLRIYDLQLKKNVWGGTIVKKKSTEANYEENDSGNYVKTKNVLVNIFANAMIESIRDKNKSREQKTDDQKYPWPKVPSREKLLRVIFTGFAENLPDE